MATKQEPKHDPGADRARLLDILKDADAVMMTTRGTDGRLRTRPMAVARVDDDGTMYFATSIDTPKAAELRQDPRIQLVFQSKSRYAAIDGEATMRSDRALVDELWKEPWKVWFPEGKDDPDIVIIVVDPEKGEYWDQSGVRGLSYIFRAAKAYVQGKAVEPSADSHGKVAM